MAKTGFTIDMKDFDKKFFNITNKIIPRLSSEGLMKGAAILLADAVKEEPAVPKSRGVTKEKGKKYTGPGNLRRSQKVEKPEIRHGEIFCEAGFDADYAAKVHEMPSSTNWTTPGTGPKFLTTKLARNKDKYMKITAEHIRQNAR